MVYFFILLGALSRLLPHPPNFAPIAALALFGGAKLNKGEALILPLASLIVSDYFISGYYGPEMFYVYGSFLLIGLLGLWLKEHSSAKHVAGAALFSSLLFFVITNFGVWQTGWYPHNLFGLIECYTAAIPFFRNTVLGDLSYTALFFGGFEIAKNLNHKLHYKFLKTSH